MRTATILALLVAAVAASGTPAERRIADKDLLTKQKNILQLVVRVHQKNQYQDIANVGNTYDIEANQNNYKYVKPVKQFIELYKRGELLQRGQIFSVLYTKHRQEAKLLFDILYSAKDYDTFFKTAAWARDHVNEGQFVYALTIALKARDDTRDLVLPPPYEIYPYLFINSQAIQQAYESRMQGTQPDDRRPYYITANYSGQGQKTHSAEQLLSYFTEDVGLSAFHTYLHYTYPSWVNSREYGVNVDRRGEIFYFVQQQILARYNLERISNGLEPVTPLYLEQNELSSYYHGLSGFYPELRYPNGQEVPARQEHEHIEDIDILTVEDAQDSLRRIKDALSLGYVWTKDGTKLSITDEKGISIIGDLIASLGDNVHPQFYGSLYNQLLSLVGHIADPQHRYGAAPGALQHYESMLRDPAYYQIIRRIVGIVQDKYKQYQQRYTYDDLAFPGVKIDNIEIDKLVTYFDKFEIDLDNVVTVNRAEDGQQVDIRARQIRLNHKPFNYRVTVSSDKANSAMVRVFLGPKYDAHGRRLDLETQRHYTVEIDRFPTKLQAGQTTIERNSRQSTVSVNDPLSTRQLFRKVEDALAGKEPFYVDQTNRLYGYPDRLLIPKGSRAGLPLYLYVILTPFEDAELAKAYQYDSVTYFGTRYNEKYPDNKPLGYPFDRPVDEYYLHVPNAYVKDVLVYHKTQEEINTV